MEINQDLHNYIVTFDNVLDENNLISFEKFCKEINFQKAQVSNFGKQSLDEKTRKTLNFSLNNLNTKSLTEVHWCNFLNYIFTIFLKDYAKIKEIPCFEYLVDIQILKYVKQGHYKFHVDNCAAIHRIYSCIFLINDEYEGGDLIFKYPGTDKITKIEKKKNRLIIWPSNFLYPHSVLPVTNGERYSVVAWAL